MGMIDMSPTLRPVTPYTVKLDDTTPAWSRGAIAAVPHECAVLAVIPLTAQDAIWASVVMVAPGVCSTGVKRFMLLDWNHFRANLPIATMISLSTGLMLQL